MVDETLGSKMSPTEPQDTNFEWGHVSIDIFIQTDVLSIHNFILVKTRLFAI